MQRKYSKALRAPIREPIIGLLIDGDPDAIAGKRLLEETIKKLQLLLEHYSIEPTDRDCWLRLSLALAFDHVNGFRIVSQDAKLPQRPKTWTDIKHYELAADVLVMQRQGYEGDDLYKLLANKPRWKGQPWARLKKRFQDGPTSKGHRNLLKRGKEMLNKGYSDALLEFADKPPKK